MIVARGYITLTNIQGSANLLDWQSQWREGSLPAGWSLNGVAAENSIIVRDNPFATKALMWKCTPDSQGGASGGFTTSSYTLDNIHTYRFTIFARIDKVISLPKEILLGCFNVDNLTGGANTNPYFIVYAPDHTEWCLLVGHIHPSKADNTWKLSTSGVYNMAGKKIGNANDFKLRNPNIPVQLRTWLYNCTLPEESACFYNPRLEVCDGNEPSIEQLLQVSTREEIDTVKVEYKSEIQKLDNKIAFSVSEVKSYTDGKVTAEAQRATADAQAKADAARVAAEAVAIAKAELAKTTAQAYADGKVTAEEQRAIADAQAKLNEAKADAQAKANAAQTAATAAAAVDATNKANAAQNNAISDAATKYTTKTEHSSAITLLSNQIEQRVTKTVFDNAISDAQLLVKAMSRGLMLFDDPTFKKGLNSVKVYNNIANSSVVITREQIAGIPNDSTYGLKIVIADGNANPPLGGFCFATATKANKVMVCRFVAKVPENQRIMFATNAIGTGSTQKWLTSDAGTGKWEEYAYYVKCGETGTFNSTFFFYLNQRSSQTYPVTWYLAYATVYDLNANEVFTPRAEYEAKITVLESSITSKVSQSTFDALGNRVTAAESSITQQAGQIASKVSQSTFDALGNRVTAAESSITQMPNKISLAVKEGVDGVQIGGRNLLLNSKVTKSSTSYHIGYWNSSRDFVVGETLTVTIKGDIPGSKLFGIWFNSGSIGAYSIYKVANGLYSRVITVPVGTTTRTIGIFLVGNQGGTDAWNFEWIKLESGNKATDWSPAPEDVEADAQAKADAARVAAEAVAVAKANLAKTESQAYADGKVTAEERRAIADAQAKLNEAKTDAQAKANAAQSAAATDATTKANAIKSNLQATGIDIENRLVTVTADTFRIQDNQQNPIAVFSLNAAGKPILSANLIDANAIITNSLLAEKIAATDITTSRLTATDGARIGEFVIENGNLICSKNFPLTPTKVMSINMDSIRFVEKRYTDQQIVRTIAVGTSTLSTATGIKPLLTILDEEGQSANVGMYINVSRQNKYTGGNIAIMAHGGAHWVQGADDKWKMPGVVWAGRVSANGGVQNYWGDGCYVSSANATAVGFYDIYHNLGHTDYYVMVTPTPYTVDGDQHMSAMICSKYSNYFTVLLVDVGGRNRRCAFEIAIIGRNTL